MRRAALCTSLVLAALGSCRAAPAEDAVLAPEGVDSAWQYLAAKYDADQDGSIAPAEYRRAGSDFAQLDGDADGALTPADFPDEDFADARGLADMSPEQRAHLRALYDARAVVLTYFEPEPGAEGLSRAALEAAFLRLDRDGDGALERAELARATDERPWGGPGEAWELLLAAADRPGDGDGRLARAELETYHGSLDSKDGLLRGPPSGWSRGAEGLASDGPPVGTPAPDFALAPPDGGAPVRLSSWAGKKPVALIFGSYT
jgi:hypothetical protein